MIITAAESAGKRPFIHSWDASLFGGFFNSASLVVCRVRHNSDDPQMIWDRLTCHGHLVQSL
ncbi:hypothetical protein [Streptomyces sp. NPDC086989]|uniref:hypothetical protein n=1 Tax=Streptomyces sp. NPDC086989 TaxID=3365764 RepID=UPI0038120473